MATLESPYLSWIVNEWYEFLQSDSILSDYKYDINIEVGDDEQDRFINIYEIDYKVYDGQYRETNMILVEYAEKCNNTNDPENAQHPTYIKQRAKRFFNWVNARYSKSYCYKSEALHIEDIRVIRCHGFGTTTKNQIIMAFEMEIDKRNDILKQLQNEHDSENYPT